MSSSFLQKFQNKMSVIGKDGAVNPVHQHGYAQPQEGYNGGPQGHGDDRRAQMAPPRSGRLTSSRREHDRPWAKAAPSTTPDSEQSNNFLAPSKGGPVGCTRKPTVHDLRQYASAPTSSASSDRSGAETRAGALKRHAQRGDVASEGDAMSVVHGPSGMYSANRGGYSVSAQGRVRDVRGTQSVAGSVSSSEGRGRSRSRRSEGGVGHRGRGARPSHGRVDAEQFAPKEEPEYKDSLDRIAYSRKGKPVEDFTPYTFDDYRSIKSKEYYELGTLGPDLQDEALVAKREARDKVNSYSRRLRERNQHIVSKTSDVRAASPEPQPKAQSKMDRAKEFASRIPKPKPKQEAVVEAAEEQPAQSELDKLAMKHMQNRALVEEIRKAMRV